MPRLEVVLFTRQCVLCYLFVRRLPLCSSACVRGENRPTLWEGAGLALDFPAVSLRVGHLKVPGGVGQALGIA